MKKLYTVLFAATIAATSQAQIIFNSDLSSWSSGELTDFMGSKTHTTDLTVTEITTGASAGTSSAQLTTSGAAHRRLSTQPVSVVNGTVYTITFWAKGVGSVRTGLFDDHTPTTSSGFTAYNSYIAINTTNWTEYTQNITATNTTSIAEFIISVQNTQAPNHIQIDSLIIMAGGTPATPGIYAIPFYSDLSDWTGSSLNDFMGSKTQTTDLSITEVTTGASAGTSYVRLATTGPVHRRFSTQPMAVVNAQGYEIKFWARGQGSIRTGLFDDHTPTSSAGFTSYNSYIAINSTTWTAYTQTITATNSTSAGEFIFSVLNTVAPNHIEIDSVSITTTVVVPTPPVSIYDIQFTTDPSGDSPLVNQVVNTGGIVTAVRNDGRYWIKSGNGPWTGIYVYHQPTTPVEIGDSVRFSATVVEYFNLTELSFINNFVNVSSGNFFMANTVTSAQANSEAYEGCLVRVNNATCTVGPNSFKEWIINDGSGTVKVDDFLYEYTPSVGTAYNVTGIVDFGFSEYKILPRDANDVSVASNIQEISSVNFSIYPNPVQNDFIISLDDFGTHELTLTDVSGKVVFKNTITNSDVVSINNLTAGIYFATVNNKTVKIIKQ